MSALAGLLALVCAPSLGVLLCEALTGRLPSPDKRGNRGQEGSA